MMGRTHTISGAVVWLAGCGMLASAGVHVPGGAAVAGAAIAAGAALLPDLDHPCSTVARTGGFVTESLCRMLARGCAWVYARTRTRLDRPDRDGHRTLTHSGLVAVTIGLLVSAVSWLGPVPAAVIVAALVSLGGLAVTRRRRTRRLVVPAGLVVAGLAWWWHAGPVLVGLAVAVGCLTHCLGDAMTNSGCPILWPIKVRGQRWFRVGTPRAVRFGTGGAVEHVIAVALVGVGLLEVTWLGQVW